LEPSEIEVLIDELEQRVERLRALYDQYFMGIEKIEPTVLRKDVDRRLWVLRREQIRNTSLRFKLNTVMQRYNTYQQYWMRICREIENGTYKRDLRRAAKKFGTEVLTIQAKKRLGKQLQRELEEEQADSLRGHDDSIDVDIELEEEPPAATPLPRKKPPVHVVSLDVLDSLEDVLGLSQDSARPAQAPPRRQPLPSFGQIDDIFSEDTDDQTRPHDRRELASASVGVRPSPSGHPAPLPRPTPRAPAPAAQPPRHLPPPPARPSAPARPPTPAQPPSQGLGLPRKAPSPQHAPSPSPPATAPARVQPSPPPAARAAAVQDHALSDARVREIYARYVQARRDCRESTSGITEDGLSRSLRATAEKLRAQHKGRQVDFDVVIKDGKAVLKPIVKG
jgi:hypothetical protein